MLEDYDNPPIIGVTHFFAEAIATEEQRKRRGKERCSVGAADSSTSCFVLTLDFPFLSQELYRHSELNYGAWNEIKTGVVVPPPVVVAPITTKELALIT